MVLEQEGPTRHALAAKTRWTTTPDVVLLVGVDRVIQILSDEPMTIRVAKGARGDARRLHW
jgi:hypothetical protein